MATDDRETEREERDEVTVEPEETGSESEGGREDRRPETEGPEGERRLERPEARRPPREVERRSHHSEPHHGEPHHGEPQEGDYPTSNRYESQQRGNSYTRRYGSKMREREAAERAREEPSTEPRPRRNEDSRESEMGEVPKYGGARDPNWEQKRRQNRREAELRQYERKTNQPQNRQRKMQEKQRGQRYRRGRR